MEIDDSVRGVLGVGEVGEGGRGRGIAGRAEEWLVVGGVREAAEVGDGGAFGAMDRREALVGVEEVEAGTAEGAGMVFEDAGGAEAEEDVVAVADLVDGPWIEGLAAVAGASAGDGLDGSPRGRRHV